MDAVSGTVFRYPFAVFKMFHSLSAVLFYVLGLSFFVAYIMLRNDAGGVWPGWWMQVADLPTLVAGAVYGGTGMYKSLTMDHRPSRALGLTIGIPLAALTLFLALMNFWGSLPEPGNEAGSGSSASSAS